MSTPTKLTPREHAQRAAQKRWGPARHVNLSTCSPELRRLILSLIQAAKSATEENERRRQDGAA